MITKEIEKRKEMRRKAVPSGVTPAEWANAMNWTIEAWKCILSGQKWIHDFVIYAPEQFFLMLDEQGEFILSDVVQVRFACNTAIQKWTNDLKQLVCEMRVKGEWDEALKWEKLINQITDGVVVEFNEKNIEMGKGSVKGYRLIRIDAAA